MKIYVDLDHHIWKTRGARLLGDSWREAGNENLLKEETLWMLSIVQTSNNSRDTNVSSIISPHSSQLAQIPVPRTRWEDLGEVLPPLVVLSEEYTLGPHWIWFQANKLVGRRSVQLTLWTAKPLLPPCTRAPTEYSRKSHLHSIKRVETVVACVTLVVFVSGRNPQFPTTLSLFGRALMESTLSSSPLAQLGDGATLSLDKEAHRAV